MEPPCFRHLASEAELLVGREDKGHEGPSSEGIKTRWRACVRACGARHQRSRVRSASGGGVRCSVGVVAARLLEEEVLVGALTERKEGGVEAVEEAEVPL